LYRCPGNIGKENRAMGKVGQAISPTDPLSVDRR
jgi:hypothetical protein